MVWSLRYHDDDTESAALGRTAKFLQNLNKAQELWDDIMKLHGKETHMWLEYTSFLRLHGDIISCRRVFQRAVQINVDNVEKLCGAFMHFEREEGTLENFDSAAHRCESQLSKVAKKREKEIQRQTELAVAQAEKEKKRKETKTQKRAEKRKLQKVGKAHHAKEDLEAEHIPKSPPEKRHKEDEKVPEDITPEEKRKDTVEDKQKELVHSPEFKKASPEAQERTVFLSNLLFHVNEGKVKEMFEECGEIAEIRLVKNHLGRSKGYAYLEYKDQESVAKALKKDRETLDGRPVFVSPFVDKTKHQMKFRFPTSLDKHTVFVSNLPFETTGEELKKEFETIGSITDVRIVTNRAGKPKGYAYVEFDTEAAASSAVVKLDGHLIKDRNIKVALSNPPARKPRAQDGDGKSGQPVVPAQTQGSRGRARTQLAMMPRALRKGGNTTVSTTTKATTVEQKETKSDEKSTDKHKNKGKGKGKNKNKNKDDSNKPAEATKTSKMSNEDFRKLIFK